MYLVGDDHPHKVDAQRLLDTLILSEERMVCNVEVLQEILHRYVAIGRAEAIQPSFDVLAGIVDEIYPVVPAEMEAAKNIVLAEYGLSARDAIHIAVMRSHGIRRILSFDTGFDRYPGLERIR